MKKKNSETEDNKVYSCKFTFADSKDRKSFMNAIEDSIPDGIQFFVGTEDFEVEEFENSNNSEKENKMICHRRDYGNWELCDESPVEDKIYNATLLALHISEGNVAKAADILEISKSQVYRRIKKYEITEEDWKLIEDEEENCDPEAETRDALIQNDWNVKSAAEHLGVSDSTVYRRMKKFGIYR